MCFDQLCVWLSVAALVHTYAQHKIGIPRSLSDSSKERTRSEQLILPLVLMCPVHMHPSRCVEFAPMTLRAALTDPISLYLVKMPNV